MSRAIYILFFIVPFLLAYPSAVAAQHHPRSTTSAYTLSDGALEIGLPGPVRYGLRPGLELSTSLSSLVSPHLEAKVALGETGGWRLASQHRMAYPTPLLRLISREGIGGLLPPDTDVPHLLALRNRMLATRALTTRRWLTLYGGFRMALGASRALPDLDFAMMYPRTAAYRGDPVIEAGARLDGYASSSVAYAFGADAFLITGASDRALEVFGRVTLRSTRRLQPHVGFRWITGSYPFGLQRHWIPLVGLRWIVAAR